MPSSVLTFSIAGKYVFTFDTVCVDVNGTNVRTMLIMFSILWGSVIKEEAAFFVEPDSFETMTGSWLLPNMYFAAKA